VSQVGGGSEDGTMLVPEITGALGKREQRCQPLVVVRVGLGVEELQIVDDAEEGEAR
jgi:hypothetical protein